MMAGVDLIGLIATNLTGTPVLAIARQLDPARPAPITITSLSIKLVNPYPKSLY